VKLVTERACYVGKDEDGKAIFDFLKINEKEISSIPFFVPSPTGQQNKAVIGAVSSGSQNDPNSGVPFYIDLIRISQRLNLDDAFSSLI
jgi:hypothetical protein